MTNESTLGYLARAFDRQREESVSESKAARARTTAEAAKAGALQSGGTLLRVKSEYDRLVREAARKMVRHAFDASGANAEDVCALVEKALFGLRDALSNELVDFFRNASWAGSLGQALGNEYLNSTDKVIRGAVDDFRHGIMGGVRLTKDPLVNVISSITNSPGAVLQAGIGNVQKIVSSGEFGDVRAALTDFINSRDVQTLDPEAKQGLLDVTDVLNSELGKPSPDAPKLARWGKRLIEIAEKLGIGIAVGGLSHLLFG